MDGVGLVVGAVGVADSDLQAVHNVGVPVSDNVALGGGTFGFSNNHLSAFSQLQALHGKGGILCKIGLVVSHGEVDVVYADDSLAQLRDGTASLVVDNLEFLNGDVRGNGNSVQFHSVLHPGSGSVLVSHSEFDDINIVLGLVVRQSAGADGNGSHAIAGRHHLLGGGSGGLVGVVHNIVRTNKTRTFSVMLREVSEIAPT